MSFRTWRKHRPSRRGRPRRKQNDSAASHSLATPTYGGRILPRTIPHCISPAAIFPLDPFSAHLLGSLSLSLSLFLSFSLSFPLTLSTSEKLSSPSYRCCVLHGVRQVESGTGPFIRWKIYRPQPKKRVEAPSLLFFSSIWLEIRSPRLASGSDYGVGWGRGTDCENATGYGRALWIQEYTDFWRRSHRRLLLRKPEAGRRRSATTTTTTDRRCLGIFFFLLLPYALHYARGAAKRSIGQSENTVAIHRRTGNGNRSVCGPFIFCLCVWRMGRGGFVIDVERSGHNRKSSRLIVATETVSSLGRTDRR